jgi:hypothetical protein
VEEYVRARLAKGDNIMRRMRTACWIPKATDTHTEYVILFAFARQQWLCQRALLLRKIGDLPSLGSRFRDVAFI